MEYAEKKFSKLISDKKLSISDNPFYIENFIDIKKYISWDILDDAINNDYVQWELIDQTGKKIEIPNNTTVSITIIDKQDNATIIESTSTVMFLIRSDVLDLR